MGATKAETTVAAEDGLTQFMAELKRSLADGSFAKLTLGKYRGTDATLQKLLIRPVQIKQHEKLFFLFRHQARDTVKNFEIEDGVRQVHELLGQTFQSAHMFTTSANYEIEFNRHHVARITRSAATVSQRPSATHNRKKQHRLDPSSFYFKALGVSTDNGQVKDKMQDKWKQVNRFVEILDGLCRDSALAQKSAFRVLDMGAGKGYLTFALYDFLCNQKGQACTVTGVDTRAELLAKGNEIALESGFTGLRFESGFISEFAVADVDLLIALHACDTATDDAIFKGVSAGAELIVCAPCCHHEIRPQIVQPALMRGLLKHGVMLERTAELITDGIRSLLLEYCGYSTKVFEFISTEHTAKNLMIVGTRRRKQLDQTVTWQQIQDLKRFYGIAHQRLESLLLNSPFCQALNNESGERRNLVR